MGMNKIIEWTRTSSQQSLTSCLSQQWASQMLIARDILKMLPTQSSFHPCLDPRHSCPKARWGFWVTCIEDQPGQNPTASTEDASLQGLIYIPALSASHLPIFMIPLTPAPLPSSPESCISHISIILSAAKSLLLTGNLRQTHYGHKSVEHRALV